MRMNSDLTILIVCRGGKHVPMGWGSLDALAPLLSEVIVVSAEPPCDWPALPDLHHIRFLTSPWGNRNRSRNTGLKSVMTPWVYLLDEDVQAPTKSHLHQALTDLKKNPERIGVAGPYQNPPGATYWSRTYNSVSNAWARNGRFLAGHVILPAQNIEFSESFLTGGEEIRLLEEHPHLRNRIAWNEDFSALHHREMSALEFLRKGFEHGSTRFCQESAQGKMRRTAGIPLRNWPGMLIFQAVVELGALFKSKRPASNDAKIPHIQETSSRNPFRGVDRTL